MFLNGLPEETVGRAVLHLWRIWWWSQTPSPQSLAQEKSIYRGLYELFLKWTWVIRRSKQPVRERKMRKATADDQSIPWQLSTWLWRWSWLDEICRDYPKTSKRWLSIPRRYRIRSGLRPCLQKTYQKCCFDWLLSNHHSSSSLWAATAYCPWNLG